MTNKPGPKPKYGETLVAHAIRFTPDQLKLYARAGTADFWRPAIEQVAVYKTLLDDGKLTLAEYQYKVGEAIAQVTIHYGQVTHEQT